MTIHRCLTLLLLSIAALPISAQVWSIKDLNVEEVRIAISPDSTMMLTSIGTDVVAWSMADGKEL